MSSDRDGLARAPSGSTERTEGRKLTLLATALAFAPFLLTSCRTAEASGARASARVRADIALARGLASDLRYFDYAEELLDSADCEELPRALREELELARCHVQAEKARTLEEHTLTHELLEDAVRAYGEYIANHPESADLRDAQIDYVELSCLYARRLELLRGLRTGEDAARLREHIEEVLTEAVVLNRELVEAFEWDPGDPPTRTEHEARAALTVNLARMLHTWGRVSRRDDLIEEARRLLHSL